MDILINSQQTTISLQGKFLNCIMPRALYFLLANFLCALLSASSFASTAALSLPSDTEFRSASAHLQYWANIGSSPSQQHWLLDDDNLWKHSGISKHWQTSSSLRLFVANDSDSTQPYIIDARQVRKNKSNIALILQAPLSDISAINKQPNSIRDLNSVGPNLFEFELPPKSMATLGIEFSNKLQSMPQITLWKKSAFNAEKSRSSNVVFLLGGILIAYFILATINALGTRQYISIIGALFAFTAVFTNNILLNHIFTLATHSVNTNWLTYSATVINMAAFVIIIVWLMPRSRYKELLSTTQWLIVICAALLLPLALPVSSYYVWMLLLSLAIAITTFCISAFYFLSDHRYSEVMLISALKIAGSLAQLWLMYAFNLHLVTCFSYIEFTSLIHAIEVSAILSLTLYLVRKEQVFLYQESIAVAKEEQKIATLSPLIHASRHDLREPLSDIIGLADLVSDHPLDQSQRENIYAIQNVAKTALEKINSLFSYNYPLRGSSGIHANQFQLTSLVSECSSFYSYQLQEANNELVIDFENSVPERLEGDQDTLRQILLHIFEQLALNMEGNDSHFNFSYSEGNLRIRFDAPPTMSLAKSFDNNSKPLLLRTLIKKANGLVELSETNRKLTITLPLDAPKSTPERPYDNTLTKGKHVLVIDDNPAACNVIASYLERWNIHVHTANNLAQARAIVRHQTTIACPIDLIVIDYLLGETNGIELVDALSQSVKNTLSTPVILMSNALDLIDMEAAKQRDIHHILEKPVMPETLQAAVVESFHLQKTLSDNRPTQNLINSSDEIAKHQTVLVVEDNSISAKIIAALLNHYRVNYDIASTAEQALTLFTKNHYPIVILDCQLPDASGYTVAKQMRHIESSREHTNNMPSASAMSIIIGVSADDDDDNKALALAQGMNHYFTKPVTHEQLAKFFI